MTIKIKKVPFKLGYFLSDVMTHAKGTQAAVSQNNKFTKEKRLRESSLCLFP